MKTTPSPKDNPGLCVHCGHLTVVRTSGGAKFLLCGLSKLDRRFPRYPRIPVVSCEGFEESGQKNDMD